MNLLSGSTYEDINYNTQNMCFEKNAFISNPEYNQIAETMFDAIFFTAEILKDTSYFSRNKNKRKANLKKLVKFDFFKSHSLYVTENYLMPVYSVSKTAFLNAINSLYHHKYWCKYSTNDVIKILSINRLFFLMQENGLVLKIDHKDAIVPFDAELHLTTKEELLAARNEDRKVNMSSLGIISIRETDTDLFELERRIKQINSKTLVIIHDKSRMKELMPLLSAQKDNLRITFDEDINSIAVNSDFTNDIATKFFIIDDDKLKRCVLKRFMPTKKNFVC